MCVARDKNVCGPEQRPFSVECAVGIDETPEAVDMAALASLEDAQVEGEPDLIVELIDLYLEDVANKLAVIREAFAKLDEAALRCATHSLRGSSASLGALRVAAICEELELIGCADTGRTGAARDALEQECELVRRTFAAERLRRSSVKI